ncbi:tail fiber assembly protein [Dryocola sp. BD586]|uniref:tail fiber assembly protein n=1 Tax=Dryocola sp. BD586 TaxID=3133271 RepID=UPI003F4F8569
MAFKFSGKDRTIRIYNLGADTREFIGAGDVCIPANTGLPADGKYCADGRVRGKSHRIYRNKVGDCRGLPKSNALQQRNGLGALPADVTTIAPDGNYMDWNGEGWEKDTEAECAAAVSFAESEKKRLMQEGHADH